MVESKREAGVHHAVSFTAQNTYVGLPQMKAYNSINIRCGSGVVSRVHGFLLGGPKADGNVETKQSQQSNVYAPP